MKAKGGNWTFGELYAFLANPRGYIPGTNMTFAGLARGQQRADVIDYLHTLSDNPLPLPKAAANRRLRLHKPAEAAKEVENTAGYPRCGRAKPGRFVWSAAPGRWWRTEKPT